MSASADAHPHTEDLVSSRADLTVNVLPEVAPQSFAESDSQTGVSLRNALPATVHLAKQDAHWYIMRATYNQEKKACEALAAAGYETYYPTITKIQAIKGEKQIIEASRLLNIFFVRATYTELRHFIQHNEKLEKYVRFYCRRYYEEGKTKYQPLTIPASQLESLRIICAQETQDILLYEEAIRKFQKGDMVIVTDGDFKGVVGRVARLKGQLRVGIIINNEFTAVTAYIPNGLLASLDDNLE